MSKVHVKILSCWRKNRSSRAVNRKNRLNYAFHLKIWIWPVKIDNRSYWNGKSLPPTDGNSDRSVKKPYYNVLTCLKTTVGKSVVTISFRKKVKCDLWPRGLDKGLIAERRSDSSTTGLGDHSAARMIPSSQAMIMGQTHKITVLFPSRITTPTPAFPCSMKAPSTLILINPSWGGSQ
jgi:hypothetical protein